MRKDLYSEQPTTCPRMSNVTYIQHIHTGIVGYLSGKTTRHVTWVQIQVKVKQ